MFASNIVAISWVFCSPWNLLCFNVSPSFFCSRLRSRCVARGRLEPYRRHWVRVQFHHVLGQHPWWPWAAHMEEMGLCWSCACGLLIPEYRVCTYLKTNMQSAGRGLQEDRCCRWTDLVNEPIADNDDSGLVVMTNDKTPHDDDDYYYYHHYNYYHYCYYDDDDDDDDDDNDDKCDKDSHPVASFSCVLLRGVLHHFTICECVPWDWYGPMIDSPRRRRKDDIYAVSARGHLGPGNWRHTETMPCII